ncbi:unnamed protein product [Didymodactylos carnosus]|uniref:PLAT domain-containing protein n=1 Tax=Didymodactylos carnosus TaxID=1234261 RepID=A0A815YGQ5_9BILA|nr:unnamed protein product [Didymodactylos carnosus]CAF4433881.1 unnamed protein product [Didymodactylos carnosus]
MTSDVHYKVTVQTGEIGTSANVSITIFGDNDQTPNLALTGKEGDDVVFEKDGSKEFDLQSVDVGKITKINIGHDGKGEDGEWYLNTIKIEKDNNQYIFKADRLLSDEKNDKKTNIDLFPEDTENERTQTPKPITPTPTPKKDQSQYKILIKTSAVKNAGTDANVGITIFGDKGETSQLPLTDTKQGKVASFEENTTNEFEIEGDDVGKINKINIGHNGKGTEQAWHLSLVEIHKGGDSYKFTVNKWLDDEQGDQKTYIDLTPDPAGKAASAKSKSIRTDSPRLTPQNGNEPVKSPLPQKSELSKKKETPRPGTPPTTEKKPAPAPSKPKITESSYQITVKTGEKQESHPEATVSLIINGDQKQTEKLSLNQTKSNNAASFAKSSTDEFVISAVDVGSKIQRDDELTVLLPYRFKANQLLDEREGRTYIDLYPESSSSPKKIKQQEPKLHVINKIVEKVTKGNIFNKNKII